MIIITERDKKFLTELNETGACDSKFPLKFYKKRFSRNKLEHMEKEKIINRKYNLITLGVEGKVYLESIGVVPKIVNTMPIATQRRLARALDLKQLLVNFEVVTSALYKKSNNLNRGMLFVAAAKTSTHLIFLIYDVPKIISAETKTQILRELKNKKGVINNAIIFTRNKEFVQMLSTNNVYISELLIMPPSNPCIALLNAMAEGDFDRRVISAAYPELLNNKMFNKKQTKYMLGNYNYINLIFHNLSAICMLNSLDKFAIQNNTLSKQIYTLICLDNQEYFLKDIIKSLNFKKLIIKFKTIVQSSFIN